MKNIKHYKQLRENAFVSVLSSLLTVFIVTVIGSVNKADVVRFMEGVTVSDLERIEMPSPIVDSGTITGGISLKPDENGSINKEPFKEQIKAISKKLVLEKDALIIITASARCKYRFIRIDPANNLVISRISVDGIERVKDSSYSKGLPVPVFTSSTFMEKLEAGEHQIKAEGVFCGYSPNYPNIDVRLSYVVFKTDSTPMKINTSY